MKQLKKKWITKTIDTRLYQIPVPIIGLTGGIATGKSTVAKFFREKNMPVIDADLLVKNIYKKNETIAFLKHHYPEVLSHDFIIDFKKLRALVFQNAEDKKKIEDYIYSYLPQEFKNAFAELSNPAFIIYDVPLLFEKKLDLLVDVAVCVYSNQQTQISRLIKRDQISHELAEKILLNQLPIDQKKDLSQFIIKNEKTLDDLTNSFESILDQLFEDRA